MEDNLVKSENGDKGRVNITFKKSIRHTIILASVLLVILIISIGYFGYSVSTYAKIFPGIYINTTYVGGENTEDVIDKLSKIYNASLKEGSFKITSKEESISVNYADIETHFDIEGAVAQAFDYGRSGNILKKMFEVISSNIKHLVIPVKLQVNEEKLKDKVDELSTKVNILGHDYRYEVNKDKLFVFKEKLGEEINVEQAILQIVSGISNQNSDQIVIIPEQKSYKKIDINEIYDAVVCEPSDAKYKVESYRITIVPEKAGADFSKDEAIEIMSNQPEKEIYVIPLILKKPKLTKRSLLDMLFKDKLGSFKTDFNAENVPRSYNIELAASKINGVILGPDDVFSFNEIVGDRTQQTGFKNAQVYFGDEIIDGVGGGICQVSTTLYNAVLVSDLKVLNRVNHSMTVSYAPFGQDAAVAYGLLDFKFKNSTGWPIKMIATKNKGSISFDIYGVNENPLKKVEIYNNIIKTIPYPTEHINSEDIYVGETKIKQKGGDGYVIETYKTIKENGKIIENTFVSKSSYKPIKEKILRGIKKASSERVKTVENGKVEEVYKQIPVENPQGNIYFEQEQPAGLETPTN